MVATPTTMAVSMSTCGTGLVYSTKGRGTPSSRM
jgi:hypothetical protein